MSWISTKRSDGTRAAVLAKEGTVESEIRIISHGQGISTQRNHVTILKEHSLTVMRVLHSMKRLLV